MIHDVCRLMGNPNHMNCIRKSLENEYPPEQVSKHGITILVISKNSGFRSYDGVKVGGLRVVEEVSEN